MASSSTIKDISAVKSPVRQDDLEGSVKQGLYDESTLVLDPAAERSLCTKFDLRLMPILGTMCMYVPLADVLRCRTASARHK